MPWGEAAPEGAALQKARERPGKSGAGTQTHSAAFPCSIGVYIPFPRYLYIRVGIYTIYEGVGGSRRSRSRPRPAPEHVRVARCREGKCARRRPRPGCGGSGSAVAEMSRGSIEIPLRDTDEASRARGGAGRAIRPRVRPGPRLCPGLGARVAPSPRAGVTGVAGQRSRSAELSHRGLTTWFNSSLFKVCCYKARLERFRRSMWRFVVYGKVWREVIPWQILN